MRRLSIIVIILTLCALTSLSQPRVNSSKTYSVVASSQILSYPVGWEFNDLGKWCGYYGVISGDYQNNSKTPKRLTAYAMSGYNSKGIVSLQFKKIKSFDKIYFVLYHIYYDGYYDYPAIYEDWHYNKCCMIYVFTEDEYHRIFDIVDGINTVRVYASCCTSEYYSYLSKEGQEHLEGHLKRLFENPISSEDISKAYNHSFAEKWYIKKENANTIRFALPTSDMLWEEAQKINEENARKREQDKWYYKSDISKYNCVDFSTRYFEVSKIQFDKLKIK